MTSKERVKLTLEHKKPDRVPVDFGGGPGSVTVEAYERLRQYLGINPDTCQEIETWGFMRVFDTQLYEILPVDFYHIGHNYPDTTVTKYQNTLTYTDEWRLQRIKKGSDYQFINNPLKDLTVDEIITYPWPEPNKPGRIKGLRTEAKRIRQNTDMAITGHPAPLGIFEFSYLLRGMEQFMVDMYSAPEICKTILGKVTEVLKGIYIQFLDEVGEYLDIVRIGDDLGSQNNLLMSPENYAEFIQPFHKELIKSIKEHSDAKVMMHSCGDIYNLIPFFIDNGVDVLNPIQTSTPNLKDTLKLKRKFGSQICFHGAIDSISILRNGNESIIKGEIQKQIANLGTDGGYILAATHVMDTDVPMENIITMFEAVQNIGIPGDYHDSN